MRPCKRCHEIFERRRWDPNNPFCFQCDARNERLSKILAVSILVAIAAVLLGFSVGYARWMYGDWKCGMPGVQCRKEK